MNISKLALIALLGSALMAFGCGDSTGDGGSGGTGGAAAACVESSSVCMNGDIEPIEETCMLPAAPTDNNCVGDESLENPASCTATLETVSVTLTQLQINGDCNSGYDLDSCSGNSCLLGGLAPGEGLEGIDNALAGLAPVLAGVGGNLGGVDQAFHDGLCTGDITISFVIDVNPGENCATVVVDDGETTGDPIVMNLSDTGCLSGTIGTIPLNVAGVPGSMGNAVLRATVTSAGLSTGALGATVDEATAGAIADQLIDGGSAVVAQVLDINDDLSGDVANGCNALSMTLSVAGPAEEAPQ